jgi:3-methyladenine DNA glycosylase AlkD
MSAHESNVAYPDSIAIQRGEFFLRKAIGWALRQYAWTDSREIQRYVREHAGRLSPLSAREALKNVSA